jgi:hypothetical protein
MRGSPGPSGAQCSIIQVHRSAALGRDSHDACTSPRESSSIVRSARMKMSDLPSK